MGALGVTEWENLGYRDSGMMDTDGQPRSALASGRPTSTRRRGRLTWLVRSYQPDVMTTYNEFGGYGHPDHIRTHDVGVRAFERAGDPPGTRSSSRGPGCRAWAPVEAVRAGDPGLGQDADGASGCEELGQSSFW